MNHYGWDTHYITPWSIKNQLINYVTHVQHNVMSESPLYIITDDRKFITKFSMEGTILFDNTHTTSDNQLCKFPHINLSSPHPWDSMKFSLPNDLDHWMSNLEGGYM